MDKKFEKWTAENKDFCEKADTYQIQVLYISSRIQEDIEVFIDRQECFDKTLRTMSYADKFKILTRIKELLVQFTKPV